jgi:hypothetical protein
MERIIESFEEFNKLDSSISEESNYPLTIKKLKNFIKDLPDDMLVGDVSGRGFEPCVDIGVSTLSDGTDILYLEMTYTDYAAIGY